MKLRKHSNSKRAHACIKATEIRTNTDTEEPESEELPTKEPQDHQTEEPQTEALQDLVFHDPMKLSELVQRYLRHQPARFAATIRQQQQAIEELRYQKESLESGLSSSSK